MGRIMCRGSPVVLASANTTTDSRTSVTSDCASRKATKRIMMQSREAVSPPPATRRLLAGRQLVDEQIVHHGAGGPLAERLGRRVRRVNVDHRHAVVLAAEAREDVAHERVDLV